MIKSKWWWQYPNCSAASLMIVFQTFWVALLRRMRLWFIIIKSTVQKVGKVCWKSLLEKFLPHFSGIKMIWFALTTCSKGNLWRNNVFVKQTTNRNCENMTRKTFQRRVTFAGPHVACCRKLLTTVLKSLNNYSPIFPIWHLRTIIYLHRGP